MRVPPAKTGHTVPGVVARTSSPRKLRYCSSSILSGPIRLLLPSQIYRVGKVVVSASDIRIGSSRWWGALGAGTPAATSTGFFSHPSVSRKAYVTVPVPLVN